MFLTHMYLFFFLMCVTFYILNTKCNLGTQARQINIYIMYHMWLYNKRCFQGCCKN